MTINRDEFDRLVGRVDRIEHQQNATTMLIAAEVVGLRTHVDEAFAAIDRRFDDVDRRFDAVDRRFEAVDARFDAMDLRFDAMEVRMDGFEAKLDRYTDQVGIAITVGTAAVEENRRLNEVVIKRLARTEKVANAIVGHFGIEVPED
jgi:hypothetical protein